MSKAVTVKSGPPGKTMKKAVEARLAELREKRDEAVRRREAMLTALSAAGIDSMELLEWINENADFMKYDDRYE